MMVGRQEEKSWEKRKERLLFFCTMVLILLIFAAAILVLNMQGRASELLFNEGVEDRGRMNDSAFNPYGAVEGEWVVSYGNESGALQGIQEGGNALEGSDDSGVSNNGGYGNSVGHEDWRLILVNEDNPVPEGFQPNLITLDNGQRVDERILEPLNEMFAAARSEGIVLQVNSGYRSIAEQQIIFDHTLNHWLASGLSAEAALVQTRRYVATPGTSEHHLGLAIDISESSSWAWLHENSAQFGFILRYPRGTEHITGFAYEPWHFRYVGVENAREIHRRGITLEEFVR